MRGPLRRSPRGRVAAHLARPASTTVSAAIKETMLTDARIMAIVPTTDLAQRRSTARRSASPDASVPTPGPQVVYRCGGGTLLEVYERPTAGEAQHTLASWEVSDIRAAVDQLRSHACVSRCTTSRRSTPRTAARRPETSARPGFATPTATSCASIPTQQRTQERGPGVAALGFTPVRLAPLAQPAIQPSQTDRSTMSDGTLADIRCRPADLQSACQPRTAVRPQDGE
jgi:hypothetical protein